MNKFEKLKKHIEDKAKEKAQVADEYMLERDRAKTPLARQAFSGVANSYIIRARTLYEIIDFMNNMED